jgi:hypothetical protein
MVAKEMKAYPVSLLVNNPKNDNAKCMTRMALELS